MVGQGHITGQRQIDSGTFSTVKQASLNGAPVAIKQITEESFNHVNNKLDNNFCQVCEGSRKEDGGRESARGCTREEGGERRRGSEGVLSAESRACEPGWTAHDWRMRFKESSLGRWMTVDSMGDPGAARADVGAGDSDGGEAPLHHALLRRHGLLQPPKRLPGMRSTLDAPETLHTPNGQVNPHFSAAFVSPTIFRSSRWSTHNLPLSPHLTHQPALSERAKAHTGCYRRFLIPDDGGLGQLGLVFELCDSNLFSVLHDSGIPGGGLNTDQARHAPSSAQPNRRWCWTGFFALGGRCGRLRSSLAQSVASL
jgi:hypothetical protein